MICGGFPYKRFFGSSALPPRPVPREAARYMASQALLASEAAGGGPGQEAHRWFFAWAGALPSRSQAEPRQPVGGTPTRKRMRSPGDSTALLGFFVEVVAGGRPGRATTLSARRPVRSGPRPLGPGGTFSVEGPLWYGQLSGIVEPVAGFVGGRHRDETMTTPGVMLTDHRIRPLR